MPLEPRVKAFMGLASKIRETDAPYGVQRDRASRAYHLFGWVAIRPGPKVASIEHVTVPVEGGQITVRIYRPFQKTKSLHVFIHGGGWCMGTLDERDSRCQGIAVDTPSIVASVEYRLAPECQYPTAPEDCYAALCWLVEHFEPERVTIGGESAGGNLAAVACLMARDRKGPAIDKQLLDVPATDLTMSQPSIEELGEGYLLNRTEMGRYIENYLGDTKKATEAYASPLHAKSLKGLPAAHIMTAEFDPLRDEGKAYADKLEAAGVEVKHVRLEGHIHPSFAFTQFLPSAREYHTRFVAALRG